MKKGEITEAVEALIILLRDFDDSKMPKSECLIRAEDKLRTCINNYGNIVFGTLTNKSIL